MLVNIKWICRSPVPRAEGKGLGLDIPGARNLPTPSQLIHKSVGVAQESFAAPKRQIDDSIEFDLVLREI